MNTPKLLITLLMMLWSVHLQGDAVTSRQIIAVVGPVIPVNQADAIARLTANLLVECRAGSRVCVIDAERMSTVVDVTLPDGSARLRQQRLGPQIAAIVSTVRGATNVGHCFNVPVLLDYVSRQVRNAGTSTTILLLGPTLYQNPKEPAFDLTKVWPSDGHLSAGSQRSIFSTADRAGRLADVAVAWWITDIDAFVNENHREGITRFWGLFVSSQGGALMAFSPDARNVFGQVLRGRSDPLTRLQPDPSDNEVAMKSVSVAPMLHQGPTNSVTLPPPAPKPAPPTRPLPATIPTNVAPARVERAPDLLPVVAEEDTGIGIVWLGESGKTTSVDLDLYVQPPRGGPELYFGSKESPHGRYFRDLRHSQTSTNGQWKSQWEFVELQGDQLPPFVWVNMYDGVGPVRGELRIQHRGRMYSREFILNCSKGDQAAGRADREGKSTWCRIDVDALVNPSRGQ